MIEHDEIFRLRTTRTPGTLARVLAAIGSHGAHIGEIETIVMAREFNVRDVTVISPDSETVALIRRSLEQLEDVEIVEQSVDKVFSLHEGGKIEVRPTVEVRNLQDIREVYTPGVARVSNAIAADPSLAGRYTWKGNTVAIVSDGSRVLGLGDVGPEAALPVIEGKALFYSKLVGINGVPVVLDTNDPDEIIATVTNIAPGFGGIHLEDIATPGVYSIEDELIERLDIPVMHDDQHGTAVVVLAAVLSAARLLDRPIESLTFGQVGLGAAGSAIARLALSFPFQRVLAFDPGVEAVRRLGRLGAGSATPLEAVSDGFERVVRESHVLIMGTGRPGLLSRDQVTQGQVIMAISNPVPEISMEEAKAGGASLAADGSIVNNVLAYPGLFRGALDAGADSISMNMKRAAAEALSSLAPDDLLLPDALDLEVHRTVTRRVREAAE